MIDARATVSPAEPATARTRRPADLSAAELLAAYRLHELSPVEVMRDVIARIEASEPRLGALYAFDPVSALFAASVSETRWLAGTARPLEGLPATIKENIATLGVPLPLGTAARDLVPARTDAPPAARLREAGAIIFAKTTMPDFGMLSSGLSSFHPLARNPWNLAMNPGGSSAGAATAAAAGYGPLHVGTDIGGSIRLPANWCGIVGLKPSHGRVPIDPAYYGRVAGPMARDVGDVALMMRELSRADPRDPTALQPQDIDWGEQALELKGLRLGLMLDAGVGLDVEPRTARIVTAAARRFEAAGAIVTPVKPPLTRAMLDGLDLFWRQRAWSEISQFAPPRRDRILPYILTWANGAAGASGADVFHGFSQMAAIRDAMLAMSGPYDFVLSPVSPVPSFPAEQASPLDDPERPFEHIGFTVGANMSEQPAICVPAGMTDDRLPVGLQIIGRRFDDSGVLRLARAFEQLRDPLPAWPVF
jgi:aspartyl-tRNA(Asn)/glutamyl-tRNA(Gln) amidotransferase subunit A